MNAQINLQSNPLIRFTFELKKYLYHYHYKTLPQLQTFKIIKRNVQKAALLVNTP